MRLVLALASCLLLQGCWFFIFPIPRLGDSANACAPENAYIGQKLENKEIGKFGTIKELHGRHQRCQNSAVPILATVEYE